MHSRASAPTLSRSERSARPSAGRQTRGGAPPTGLAAAALGLQRTAGNGATARVLGAALDRPKAPEADGAAALGQRDAPSERLADRRAAEVTERLSGHSSGRAASGIAQAVPDAGQRPDPSARTPRPVEEAVSGRGEPLDPATRSRMGSAFGKDFPDVRVHRGPDADAAAGMIGADAYALGPHLAFRSGTWRPGTVEGDSLIAHELAHVEAGREGRDAPHTVRRAVGFFESVARFFGGGTFGRGELLGYLRQLEERGRIEDEFDSDNKARAAVDKGMHKDRSFEVRVLLIREVFSGHVAKDDEKAAVQILEDAGLPDRMEMIREIGHQTFEDELTGERLDRYWEMVEEVEGGRPFPVPLDWRLDYTVSGAPEFQRGPQGLLLQSLSVLPRGADKATSLAADRSVTTPAGEPVPLGQDVPHPRDLGGQVTANALPGAVEKDTVLPVQPGARADVTASYPAVTRTYDTATVELDVYLRPLSTGADITGREETTGRDVTTSEAERRRKEQKKEKSVEEARTEEETEVTGREEEVSTEERKGREKATTKETGKRDVKKKETETSKETETQKRSGSATIDVDLKLDADLKGKIEGEAEVGKGGGGFVRKIWEISEPVRRPLLRRVLRRYLGPGGRVAEEVVDKLIDGLMGDKPDLTVEYDGKGSAKIKGKLTGKLAQRWNETVDISRSGTRKTTGTEKETSERTATEKRETEEEAKGTAERERKEKGTTTGRETRQRETEGTVEAKETETGKAVTKKKSESSLEQKVRDVMLAVFDRAELRVRLTGAGGKKEATSGERQRGGGGAAGKGEGRKKR